MAKKTGVEKGEQKANLYLLAIVAIVAVVGIVVLVLNSGGGSLSIGSNDLTGQAYTSSIFADTYCPAHYKSTCAGGWTYSRSTGDCLCGGEAISTNLGSVATTTGFEGEVCGSINCGGGKWGSCHTDPTTGQCDCSKACP